MKFIFTTRTLLMATTLVSAIMAIIVFMTKSELRLVVGFYVLVYVTLFAIAAFIKYQQRERPTQRNRLFGNEFDATEIAKSELEKQEISADE